MPQNVIERSVASYRKIWEWAAILQALEEREMLKPGKRGLGFAVGTESLSSIFANLGVEITATDRPAEVSHERWVTTGQHAGSLDALYHPDRVSEAEFKRLVTFAPVDMKDLSGLTSEQYDFLWSSCALEHLGNLANGMEFVKAAMRLLKPGGVAVHTTEFNCGSNSETCGEGFNVLYRRRDLDELSQQLTSMGHKIEPFDYDIGSHRLDWDFDSNAYLTGNGTHIKLFIDGHVATSCVMIIQKSSP